MSDHNTGLLTNITLPLQGGDWISIQFMPENSYGRSGTFSILPEDEATVDGKKITRVSELSQFLFVQCEGHSVEVTITPDSQEYGLSKKTAFVDRGPNPHGAKVESHGTTRQEVVADVTAFVTRKYAGDWKKAFDAEDEDGDGRVSRSELQTILAKSGVGNGLTRWAIALQIISVMDADGDGYVSFDEFQKMTNLKGV